MSKVPFDELAYWSFSEDGPFKLDKGNIKWLKIATLKRKALKRQLAEVLKRSPLPPSQRIGIVAKEFGSAFLPWYLTDRRTEDRSKAVSSIALRLKDAFLRLGPTYIKLGQILSSGRGVFPDEIVNVFATLKDKVPPEDFSEIEKIISEDFGKPIEALFSEFDQTPVAAASIAQVHYGKLKTGEEVAVKVQRPKIDSLVKRDIKVMNWLAPSLVGKIPVAGLANPPALVELFAETILEELDFRIEAQNMLDIAHVLASTNQRSVIVPRPHPEFVTKRVLVMERMNGINWDDVKSLKEAKVDPTLVLRSQVISFFEGAMLFGVFHGDLHSGNLFVRGDGKVILLDFGITGRFNQKERLSFMKIIVAGLAGDVRTQIEGFIELKALPKDTDIDQLIKELNLEGPAIDPTTLSPEEIVAELQKILKALLNFGAKLPKELMLFVKNMIFMDYAVGTLAPDLDIINEIVTIANYFALHHGDQIAKETGINPNETSVDVDQLKASLGMTKDKESVTYKELQERSKLIRKRMEDYRRETKKVKKGS